MHLPPRGVTWDRSYMYIIPTTYLSCSVGHVTPKLKDAHWRESERTTYLYPWSFALQRVYTAFCLFVSMLILDMATKKCQILLKSSN